MDNKTRDCQGAKKEPKGKNEPPNEVVIEVDGEPLAVRWDQNLAAALIDHRRLVWRITATAKAPRGYFCGIGICQDCLVTVDGVVNVQACRTTVRPGMRINTQIGLPLPEK